MSTTLTHPLPKQRQSAGDLEPALARSRAAEESKAIYDSYRPENLHWKNIDWITLVWMIAMHAGCLAAPFYFTWGALGVTVVLHWLTCSIGVCLGYHRYLAHGAMKLTRPAEFFVLLSASLSGEGSPLAWAATHRLHHQRPDQYGDPHSPKDGKWWSHLLWLFVRHSKAQNQVLFERYVPELAQRPMVRFFERSFGYWLVAIGVALLALGGLPWLLWGLCVRMVISYHSTWFVNSATHLWGYRNYETRDQSRNLWWVALFAYGEGWHNNHHAYPHTARAGHHWWEVDMTWWAIKFLRYCGLATEVDDSNPTKAAGTTS